MMSNIVNISAYHFMALPQEELPTLKSKLLTHTAVLKLKGTILLSSEGVNIALAGVAHAIAEFKTLLVQLFPELANLEYRETYSNTQPFQHLFVKIKKQIIPFSDTEIPLEKPAAPYIAPEEFAQWLANNEEMTVLDTRNQYEIEAGTFKNSLSLNLKHFRDFPKFARTLPESLKTKPVVTFCTGGIRCEKAATALLDQGFKNVYQLKGGILNYFERCGSQHYEGGCFVFDEREVVYPPQTEVPSAV
jgi:UPF0176 protein